MDKDKNIEKSDTVSRFIDAEQLHTNPFGGNGAAFRLYSRCERIVAAVYLLTRHIDRSEQIRERIRGTSIDLLDAALSLKDVLRTDNSLPAESVSRDARKLISLTRILTAGSYISFANAEVLIGALDELATFISASQRTGFSENILLTKEDLIGHEFLIAPSGPISVRKSIKDTNRIKDMSISDSIFMSDTMSDTKRTSDKTSAAKNDFRNQAILQLLSNGGELGIKDICENLPEFSEKTVQRTLADLVRENRIKKQGEKRWSRYSLVSGEIAQKSAIAGL